MANRKTGQTWEKISRERERRERRVLAQLERQQRRDERMQAAGDNSLTNGPSPNAPAR